MKTKIVSLAVFLCLSFTLSAQWNDNGDSKTTGNLSIGSTNTNNQALTINSSKSGEIIFNHTNDLKQTISSSYSKSAYGGSLSFNVLPPSSTSLTSIFTLSHKVARLNTSLEIGSIWNGNKAYIRFNPINVDAYPNIDFYRGLGKTTSSSGDTDANTLYLDFGLWDTLHSRAFIISKETKNLFVFDVESERVGIGTDNPQNALDVNGTIRAKEIRVESGWADFVFDKDYKLPTLNEVKAHIDEHKHLPGIPSAEDVLEKGLSVADMTTKMMQKIEELTLYVIQQNEKATEQQQIIEKLNKRIDELETSKNK